MNKFTDMHGRPICNKARVYFNGRFPDEIPTEKRIRDGIAIIDGDKLVFAAIINNQLQGIGLYWDFDDKPCYDLIATGFFSYLAHRRGILSSMRIWGKMTKEEREYFEASTTEIQVDQKMRYFRIKYL